MHIERNKLSVVWRTLGDGFAFTPRNDALIGGKFRYENRLGQGCMYFLSRGTQLKEGPDLPHPWELRGGGACASRAVWGLAEWRHQH